MTTWIGRLAAGIVVVGLVLTGVQLARVHQSTGELRLTPSAAPLRLSELGRHYVRSSSTPANGLPKDTQEIGETPGGGELFGPRYVSLQGNAGGKTTINPPVIWVRDDAGHVWTYELVGSP